MRNSDIHYNDGFSEKWIDQLSPPEWRNNVTAQFVDVPLSRLEHAGCWSDPDVVNGWKATLMKGGSIPPPVAVLTERGTYYLHDGNHRYLALADALGECDADPTVRVAVAVPNRDHRFTYKSFGEYGTYVIEQIPRRFARTAQVTAAVVASGTAVAVTMLVSRTTESPVFVFFVLSVMIVAWVGGLLSGLVATFANILGAAYFLLPPNGSLLVDNMQHIRQLGVSSMSMIGVVVFMTWIRQHQPIELGLRAQ